MRNKEVLSLETMKELEQRKIDFLKEYAVSESEMISSMVKKLKDVFKFEVQSMELPNNVDGVILVDSKGEHTKDNEPVRLIAVNSKLDIYKQRFTIAHEFAHYILSDNKELLAYRDHREKQMNAEEDKADYLAASILMPKEPFSKDLKELENYGDYKYNIMKIKYRVDLPTVVYREREVKLLNEF